LPKIKAVIMAKKNQTPKVITRVKAGDFIRKAAELHGKGFSVLMPGDRSYYNMDGPGDITWADFIGAQLRAGTQQNGKMQRKQIPTLYFSSGNESMQGADGKGTEGLGWIEWGFGNNLPNLVALLTHMLPYTAAGIKFNADLCAGLGPQPMYDTTQYVGGNITQKFIRYKDAGQWLRGRIIDLQTQIFNLSAKEGDSQALKKSIQGQIDELEKALQEWQKTDPQVQEFLDRNNLAQTWLSLVLDQELFGISFPELLLNQHQLDDKGKEVSTSVWLPKVTGIAHRSCHTTRMERMDDYGKINYVYCSNRWLDKYFIEQGAENNAPVNAVPSLNISSPLSDLEDKVREARLKNVSLENRPTHFVLPSVYPTAGRPYYPTPAWYSIFGGDIYEYITTIFSDRLSRKRNSNVIGRVIYLNNDYMQQLFIQAKAQSDPKKQSEIRDKLYTQINQWLANRNNAGQSLLAFTFTGNDQKEHKSFEIVEIEANSKDAVAANEKETAELSSVVFMALGLDARLLGSSPLSLVGSNGGTDIRERFLLRQILKSPQLNIMLKPLEVLSRFNQWDRHLVWQVQREAMTTLDRSKTGVTTDNPNEQKS
jgi:hypothetical protein